MACSELIERIILNSSKIMTITLLVEGLAEPDKSQIKAQVDKLFFELADNFQEFGLKCREMDKHAIEAELRKHIQLKK